MARIRFAMARAYGALSSELIRSSYRTYLSPRNNAITYGDFVRTKYLRNNRGKATFNKYLDLIEENNFCGAKTLIHLLRHGEPLKLQFFKYALK